ncbi:Short-chain dehydrogenase/reductase SDR [Minicystis rosea]|nr:Short-chain dehydrogenase/reductase SDR [Minicystis rosea]
MRDGMRLHDRTAVITGAASGIGRAIAVSLARRGCHLALADVNEAGLAETARIVRSTSLLVSEHRLDVSDPQAVAKFPAAVAEAHPRIDLLVNNAGVAVGGTFEQVSEADFEWLFSINFWGVVRMTRAFLPALRRSDDARIVNLSSVFGIVAPPGQAAYVASKFAVRGFSESLRHELEGSTVGVTVVHPGGVATSIAKSARVPTGFDSAEVERRRAGFEKHLRLPPDVAGETIVRGVEARKPRVLVGNDAIALSLVERVAPVSYWKLLGRAMSD